MTMAAVLVQIAPVVIGGVAKLFATVRDWDGTPVDPDGQTGTFRVYDIQWKPVAGPFPATRFSLAEYFFDWPVPMSTPQGYYYLEFAYAIGGEQDLARSQFPVVFG